MPTLSSAADVRYELDNLRPHIHLEETEETWDKIAKALQGLVKLCENGAYDLAPSELVSAIRTSHRPIVSAMNSERTRLCMVPMDFLSTLASAMGTDFEQLLSLFMPALLALCSRTNKVIVNRAKASILAIIESTQLASVLTYFLQNIRDKSSTLKVVIAECTLACLNSCNPPDFEKEARAVEVESIIRITARDANADVRKLSRKIFESYKILLPSRVPNFINPLSPTTKKYLDIKAPAFATQKSVPNLRAAANLNTKRPEAKASSSSSTLAARSTHSRTASSSTVSTTRSTGRQPTTTTTALTRVSRKEPAASRCTTAASNAASSTAGSAAPAPYVPVRPTQPSRVMTTDSSSQRTTSTAQRSASTTSGPSRPLRSQPGIISRSTTTTGATSASGAQRIQKETSAPTSQHQQRPQPQGLPSNNTGPRRIPMPPPPPPAPKKDAPEGTKRPSSRVDKDAPSSSTTSTRQPPVVPPAPLKKKPAISSLSSSVRDKAPAASTAAEKVGGHARSKSTAVTTSSTTTTIAATKAKAAGTSTGAIAASTARSTGAGLAASSTKPLSVTKGAAKPQWGSRPAPPAKAASGTSASGAAGEGAKSLVRKPSSRVVSSSSTAATKGTVAIAAAATISKVTTKRPITPAQIALPPSPTPEEEGVVEETENEKEGEKAQVVEEKEEEKEAAKDEQTTKTTKGSSQRSSPVFFAPANSNAHRQGEESVQGIETENVDAAEADADEDDSQAQVISRNATPTPDSERVIAAPAVKVEGTYPVEENDIEREDDKADVETPSSRQPLAAVSCNPQTPLPPSSSLLTTNSLITPSLTARTPISALLSSIERGFQYDYSPITPLSPASNYLPNLTGEGTPYSHATHAPHRKFPMKEGPVQSFNHALHVVGYDGMFEGYGGGSGNGFGVEGIEKGMGMTVGGAELGVVPVPVQLSSEKMYAMPVGLPGLDDGRLAFVELNNTSRN